MQSLSEDEIYDTRSIADSDATMHSLTESLLTNSSVSRSSEPSTDDRRLEQRQKQVEYGKNTIGYDRYISLVPKHARKKGDPVTPDRNLKCSKRCWDGLVRAWRRNLHVYDPTSSHESSSETLPLSVTQQPQKLQFSPAASIFTDKNAEPLTLTDSKILTPRKM